MRNSLPVLVASLLVSLVTTVAGAAEPLTLRQPNFEAWEGDVPSDWTVTVGARSGKPALSRLAAVPGGGVELAGDAATGQWRSLTQRVETTAAAVRLSFEAQAPGLQLENGQFNNCYVGLASFDAAGKRLGMQVREVFEKDWAPGQLVAQLESGTKSIEVIVFLSKTGVLKARKLRLDRLEAGDSFDVLVDELDRYYSFFALKGIDWRKRAAEYQAAARRAQSADEFIAAVKPLLAELKDLHVRFETAGGQSVPAFISAADRNFDAQTIAGRLKEVKQIGRMGFVGRTDGGYGYVAVGTLSVDKETTAAMLAAFDALLDAKGLIIDLRPNGGGSEPIAQQFVSRLVAEPLVYASNQFRSGPAASDLTTLGTRRVQPHSDKPYRGKVVGLIGPGCVSSGEGFALMLAALPSAKLVGQPTRGASGNPQPVKLPNGLTVHYSTWVPLQLDGQPFEGTGIAPDTRVADDPTGVKGLEAAVKLLEEGLK